MNPLTHVITHHDRQHGSMVMESTFMWPNWISQLVGHNL